MAIITSVLVYRPAGSAPGTCPKACARHTRKMPRESAIRCMGSPPRQHGRTTRSNSPRTRAKHKEKPAAIRVPPDLVQLTPPNAEDRVGVCYEDSEECTESEQPVVSSSDSARGGMAVARPAGHVHLPLRIS